MYKHVFDPIAIDEYKGALEWYGERSPASLDNFILEIDKKIERICEAPTSYKISYKKYRETSLKTFPYAVVFIVNKKTKTVVITSIYHHKRDPKRKYNK